MYTSYSTQCSKILKAENNESITEFRGVFRNFSNISDEAFCENIDILDV